MTSIGTATAPEKRDEASRQPRDTSDGSLARPALRGSIWTLGGYAASNVIRLAGNIVLTRLLFPEVFGIMALVMTFLQGLHMFSDVGIKAAIVQSPRGDEPVFLRTAWTVSCARGVILWVCSCAIATPVSLVYGQPLLGWLIPVAGLTAVLEGFESTSFCTEQRHLRLALVTAADLVSQAAGSAAMVLLAWWSRSARGVHDLNAVWAVTAGVLIGSALRTLLSHVALPGIRHRFQLDRESLDRLFSFGRWVFVSTMLTFLAGQADRLLFGKLIPLNVLGIYGIAAALAALPTQAALKLTTSVMFPAFSRLARTQDLGRVFARVRVPVLLGGAAAVSGLAACGPPLIRILYDDRYVQAGWMLRFLAAMAWFQVLDSTNGAALLSLGRVNWVAATSAAKLLCMIVLVPLGFRLAGFRGALAALAVSEALRYVTSATAASANGLRDVRRDILLTIAVAGSSALGIGAASLVQRPVPAFVIGAAANACLWSMPVIASLRVMGRRRAAEGN